MGGGKIILRYRNLPNVLTITRLIGGSLILPFLIFYLASYQIDWVRYGLAFLFALFSMTDFFDGYLARKYGLETPLGRALDPIADKFLVSSALIALLAIHKIYFIWVIILIGREIAMLSLRQFAALHNIHVNVSYLGKLKACLQMFLIIVLIARPMNSYGYLGAWSLLENILFVWTLYFTLFSFYKYLFSFKQNYLNLEN